MNKRTVCIAVVAILAVFLIAAVIVGTQILPSTSHALRISELMQPVIHAENQTMHISVSAKINKEPISLDSDVYMVTEENVSYLVLEQQELTLYVTDQILLLENGKAFKLGEKMQAQTTSYEDLLSRIGTLYGVLEITADETGDAITYGITVTGEQLDTLLTSSSLGETLPMEGIQALNLRLTEQNGKLEQIRFWGSGALNGTEVELDVTLSGFRILASGDYPIPDAIRQAVKSVDPNALFSLTEDLYRLILAMAPLADMESIDGSLALRVDCSLIQLHTEMKLSDLTASPSGQIDPKKLKALPEMVGLLCMEGDIRCTQAGDGYVYTLTLDNAAMQQLSRMILPELAGYGENLTEGMVTILLEEGAVSALEISIEGKINALIVQIPITVSAAFSFDESNIQPSGID